MLVILGNNIPQSFREHFNARAKNPASNIELLNVQNDNFPNSEARPDLFAGETPGQFEANDKKLQGQPVTIIQSLTKNETETVNEIAFKLLATVRNLKRHGAGTVTVAMPFAAFARQDRDFAGQHLSVMGDDFPFLLKAAGADRVITAEMHSKAAEKFYTDHFGAENVTFLSLAELYAQNLLGTGLQKEDIVLGAPDGADKPGDAGIRRAHELGEALWHADNNDSHYFQIGKKRNGSETKLMSFTGDVAGHVGVIVDDMSDSGGTIIHAGQAQKEHGAAMTRVYLAHGLFNEKAIERVLAEKAADGTPALDSVVVADTVPGLTEKFAEASKAHPGRVTALNVAPLFEREIMRKMLPPVQNAA
jgi:ribose-phosphate pyrophosphokinase